MKSVAQLYDTVHCYLLYRTCCLQTDGRPRGCSRLAISVQNTKIAAGKISRNRRPLTPRTWTVRKRAVFVPQGQGRSLGNSSSSAAKDNSATSSSTHKDSKCPRELGECLDSSVFDFVSIYTRCHRCGRTVALTRAGFRAHGPLRSRCPGRPVS